MLNCFVDKHRERASSPYNAAVGEVGVPPHTALRLQDVRVADLQTLGAASNLRGHLLLLLLTLEIISVLCKA